MKENGKSVFLDLVGYLLGETNVSNVALQYWKKTASGLPSSMVLANTFADLDARGLRPRCLKP